MATLKAVVYRSQRRADGTINVKIRIIHKRVVRNMATSHYVDDSQMTRGGKLKDARLADVLEVTLRDMRAAIDTLGWRVENMTCDEVCDFLKGRTGRSGWSLNFVEWGWEQIAKEKKEKTRAVRRTALLSWERIIGECDVRLITKRMVRQYLEGLGDIRATTKLLYYQLLKKIYNAAKAQFNDEERGDVKIAGNPFEGLMPEVPQVRAMKALSRDVMQRVISLERESRINSVRNLARDLFVLSFGLQGMNLIDLWQAKETDGYVEYRRQKTRDRARVDNRLVVRIEPCLRPLIERYESEGWILGRLRGKSYDALMRSVVRGMRQVSDAIGENCTFYSARHTWATCARNDIGADKWAVHEALAHSDRATSIDDYYIKRDYRRMWEVNAEVLSLFSWEGGTGEE